MSALEFIACVFALYAATKLLTGSHIAKPVRRAFRRFAFWMLPKREMWTKVETLEGGDEQAVTDDDEDLDLRTERDIRGYDFISCPVCVGVWLSNFCFFRTSDALMVLAIYGAMLFLEMIDRD